MQYKLDDLVFDFNVTEIARDDVWINEAKLAHIPDTAHSLYAADVSGVTSAPWITVSTIKNSLIKAEVATTSPWVSDGTELTADITVDNVSGDLSLIARALLFQVAFDTEMVHVTLFKALPDNVEVVSAKEQSIRGLPHISMDIASAEISAIDRLVITVKPRYHDDDPDKCVGLVMTAAIQYKVECDV